MEDLKKIDRSKLGPIHDDVSNLNCKFMVARFPVFSAFLNYLPAAISMDAFKS